MVSGASALIAEPNAKSACFLPPDLVEGPVLRDYPGPVSAGLLELVWDEPVQRARALDGLVADGLVDPLPDGTYALPS